MTDLCVHYGWNYVSILYSEGSYGVNGGRQVKHELYVVTNLFLTVTDNLMLKK